MATKYRVQNSFAAGELSPKMYGRYDTELYKQGTKQMKNFVPLLQGPAKRRPGTYYAADASTTTSEGSRLIPFHFGESDSYVLEFSNNKIRFFTQNGQLKESGSVASIAIAGGTGYTAGTLTATGGGGVDDSNEFAGTYGINGIAMTPSVSTPPSVDTIVHGSDHDEGTYDGVSLTGGTGTGAKGTVHVDSSGEVFLVIVTDAGSGYVVNDTLTISKDTIGGAADATCDVATIINMGAATITNPGKGFTSAPTIVITEGSGSSGTGATATATLGSDNDNPYELTTTISEAQTKTFDFTQSADVIYIVHPDFQPKKLARTIDATNVLRAADDTVWTLSDVDFEDGPWDEVNTDNAKLVKVTAVTGSDYAWTAVDGVGVDTTQNRFTLYGHGLMNGMKIQFPTGTGLSQGNLVTADSTSESETLFPTLATEYFVVNAQSSSFQIATEAGGSPIEFKLSKLNNLRIDSVTITEGGTGYGADVAHGDSTGNKLTATSTTGGSGFAATFETNSSGKIDGTINISNNGRNYGNATIDIVDASGTGAKLTPVIGDASVVEWTGKLDLEKKVIAKDKVCTITADGHSFDAQDTERLIRVNVFAGSEAEKTKGIRWAWFKITAVAGGLGSITATSQGEVGIVDVDTREWRMGILGGDNEWPSCIQIHQQRLVVGSSTQYPTTVWLSEAGDFHSFAPDSKIGISTGASDSIGQTIMGEQILDSNAISLTIDSDTVDEIYWIAEGKKLSLGTSGGVFNLYGSENNYTITPTNFSIIRDTSWEAADVKPVRIGNAMIYVQFNKRKLRLLTFSGEDVQYESREISYQADELVGKEMKEIVYQKQPHSLTWCRMKDGTLASMSFEDTLEVVGWGQHEIAGVNGTETAGVWSIQHGEVESMAVIPGGGRDQLWMIVRRNINGGFVRYVEFLEKFYEPTETTQDLAHFVDCGLYKTDSSEFTTANYLHLKAEELRILGDGAVQPNATVNSSSGVLTINTAVTKLVAGLPYNSELTCLTPKQAVDGSLFVVGRDRVVKAHLLLHDTLGVKIGLFGQDDDDLEEFIFRLTQDDLNTMVPLFTGNKTANILSRSLDEEQIKILCDQPFPMTLVALVSEHEMNV